jgi:hypothetical protein
MSIAVVCSGCSKTLRAGDHLAGRRCKCPECGTSLLVPAAGADPHPAPGEAEADPLPRRKKKKNKKPISPALLRTLILGGLLSVLVLVGAWVVFDWLPVDRDVKFLPDDLRLVAWLNVDTLTGSEVYKAVGLDRFSGEIENQTGLPLANIHHVILGANSGGDQIFVVRTKNPVALADVLAKQRGPFRENPVGAYRVHDGPFRSFCQVDNRTLVLGQVNAVHAVLTRDKTPEINPDLIPLIRQVDKKRAFAFAFSTRDYKVNWKAFVGLSVDPMKELQKYMHSVLLYVDARSNLDVTALFTCKDAAAADQLRQKVEEGLADVKNLPVPSSVAQTLQTVRFSEEGSQLTVQLTVTAEALQGLKQDAEKAHRLMAPPGKNDGQETVPPEPQ